MNLWDISVAMAASDLLHKIDDTSPHLGILDLHECLREPQPI